MTVRHLFVVISFFALITIALIAQYWPSINWLYLIALPLIVLGVRDMLQRKHSLLRLYPVIGHMRYLFELIRPEIQQYFVESETNGQPANREFSSLVYQRAKGARDTRPFGTIFDVYRDGYEWIIHSLAPKDVENLVELIAAAGLNSIDQLRPFHINRRTSGTETKHYGEIYPGIPVGSLVDDPSSVPERWMNVWQEASAESW
jgi:hypothetical protein